MRSLFNGFVSLRSERVNFSAARFRAAVWVALAAVLALSVASCTKTQTAALDQKQLEALPDQEGWDSVVDITKSGQPQARIWYGHMIHYPKGSVFFFDGGIKADFYDSEGRHTSLVTADSGRLQETTNRVDAYGHVVVIADSGLVLETSHLVWLPDSEFVRSEKPVRITTTEGDTLYGVGFESDAYMRKWRILNPHGVSSRRVDWSAWESSRRRARKSVAQRRESAALQDSTAQDSAVAQ